MVTYHSVFKNPIMIVVIVFNNSSQLLWKFTITIMTIPLLMTTLVSLTFSLLSHQECWHRKARVGKIQGTLTRQLTSLGMENQQTDTTLVSAPSHFIWPNFQNFKIYIFVSWWKKTIMVMVNSITVMGKSSYVDCKQCSNCYGVYST